MPDHLFCRIAKRSVIEQIRGVDQLVDLRLQRIVVRPVPVAERKHRDPGAEVQVLLSVHIIKADALSPLEHDRKTVVGMKHILLCFIHDLL